MLNKFINQATIYSVKKIIKNSMASNLNIELVSSEIRRNFDKNRSYLLYIHIPFCHTFCPFCSFHKFKYDEEKSKKYFQSLRVEMRKVKQEGFKFNSLYVGGGTTLINEKELVKTLELAKKLFNIDEISCESDPNHIEPDSLKQFQGLIDRLSVGVQSFDDAILKRVTRYKKFGSAEVLQEKIAKMQGILPYTNLDLIFNFPTQTESMLTKDIQIAKKLGVEQITTYPLMSSDLTRNTMAKAFDSVQNNHEYTFYKLIRKELSEYHANNSWSFAKEPSSMSDEYLAKHNEYIGIGSGAFSYLDGNLYVNAFDLDEYASLVKQRPHAIIASSSFKFTNRIQFHFLTWLFNGKIDINEFDKTFNTSLRIILKQELFMLTKAKAVTISNGTIYPTEFGQYLSVVMMQEFYSGMDQVRAMFRRNALSVAV